MEGDGDDYLFCMNAQNKFFQLPKLNKCCLGVELAPAHQVIKKLRMDAIICWSTHCIPLQAARATESDKKDKQKKQKNKKDMPVTEILNTCTQQRNKQLVEISCENKALIKSCSA